MANCSISFASKFCHPYRHCFDCVLYMCKCDAVWKNEILELTLESKHIQLSSRFLYPSNNEVVGVVYWFHSVRPSVCPSRLPCPLWNIYSSGWILSILATDDHYHERVCRTQWPLTLTYVFRVIRPWIRKSCPLCSVYSSRWILFIFGTSNHYH